MPPKKTQIITQPIKSFCNASTQTKLIAPIEDEPRLYNCKQCEFATTNKHNFYLHHINKHEPRRETIADGVFKFYCNVCDVGFNDIKTLASHLNTIKHKRNEGRDINEDD